MKNKCKWLVLVIMAAFLAVTCVYSQAASKTYGNIVVSQLVSVYDGDTFKVNIDGWPDIAGKNISIRIYGIDTPEIRGTKGVIKKLALDAKKAASHYLLSAKVVELRNMRRGKYFRIIAEVYVDGENLSKLLIKSGLAKEYYGGEHPKW